MNLSFNKKKSLVIITCLLATNLVTYYFTAKKSDPKKEATDEESNSSLYSNNGACAVKIERLSGYDYIKPLLFVDKECEADELLPLKQSVTNLITNYKNSGVLNSASVYLKEYSTNNWFSINPEEEYQPGSLLKVPELIAYLKMNELKPGVLDKKIKYNHIAPTGLKQNFKSKSIALGQEYTIRELLTYMIAYSDNNATAILNSNIDVTVFRKVFTDLGLKYPGDGNSTIKPKEYTLFMRTLYNSSYLNKEDSEYATELLGRCNFKEGLVSGIPSSITIAHKFGESGNLSEQQLHESGIIYLNNNPYVLTVMTKGKEYKKLPEVIKEISSIVYQSMLNNSSL